VLLVKPAQSVQSVQQVASDQQERLVLKELKALSGQQVPLDRLVQQALSGQQVHKAQSD
jgi:hypothetical protein